MLLHLNLCNKDENESWKWNTNATLFLIYIDYCSCYNLEQRWRHLECYKSLLMQVVGDYSGQLQW